MRKAFQRAADGIGYSLLFASGVGLGFLLDDCPAQRHEPVYTPPPFLREALAPQSQVDRTEELSRSLADAAPRGRPGPHQETVLGLTPRRYARPLSVSAPFGAINKGD